ncbi:hypothetical protein H6F42_06075 [Pseudanabaena sp. FACHB-1998]|uniref:hypothetical protein n=1 Tax=Pseudanabaena sp. FACHB-1998 TaxID=2692858 RepID=UPI001680F4B2|nr:hypothetical protein [Pseudanabaena sp. FACHB-1998]MBD2176482.1 hypothetical protein [Pseudanabaena sp. FACHB-1998]
MALFKILGLLAIASSVFSLNTEYLNAQIAIGQNQSKAISPAQQMLLEMQQTNAPAVGGGSMQLLRFSQNNLSFAPLEGLDRFLNWRLPEKEVITDRQTMGDRIANFKKQQRQQIISDGEMFEAINRISQ